MEHVFAPDDDLKTYLHGTHRLIAPAQTVARIRPLMAQMGITRVANVTGLDRIGVPVVMVCRPNARTLAVSQGKGLDLDAATASGLMEAAELYHAEHIAQPVLLGSLAELSPTHRFADLAHLPRVSDRFSPNLVMLWIEGQDLISGEARWLPFETVCTNLTQPAPPGFGCFASGSNGLASGNSLTEAICHGICEVIERDATTLWHASPDARTQTGLDLTSVDDPACCEVMALLVAAGFQTTVWDMSSDTGVPAFYCMINDLRDPSGHQGVGMGAHPSRAIALLRALTEAVQVRMTYISGARDDLTALEFTPHARAMRAQHRANWRAAHRPLRDFAAISQYVDGVFSGDLAWLLSRLAAIGIREVVAVDLTKPALGLSVVRVVIPGLEGADDQPAYTPGPRARQIAASTACA